MVEFYLLVLTFVAVIVALVQNRRLSELRDRDRYYSETIQNLVQRVHALERGRNQTPVTTPPPMPGEERQFVAERTFAGGATPPPQFEEPPVFAQPESAVPSAPTDWEALVGGNLLNKIGALVLVVGIALFLGYSLTMLGPGGKIAIGLAIGVSMLLAGLLLERREGYATFGRGFIGGGWATIYFTVFAAHGLEASRIIQDPVVASFLLLGVAVLMILHSLRYQREAVTALAYVIGYVSLAVSPLSSFTLVATLLLALSLVALSFRTDWQRLRIVGIALTYITFLVRYDLALYARPGLLNAQSMLWMYWLSFEASDLLQRRRSVLNEVAFWTNAILFVTGTAMHGDKMGVTDWAPICLAMSMAFLASAVVRWAFRERSAFPGAITMAAVFACFAIGNRYDGSTATMLFLLVAESLVVAGFLLEYPLLRGLGLAFHAVPLVHWFDAETNHNVRVTVAGFSIHKFSLTALALAATYIANRVWLRGSWIYTSAAAMLIAIVIHEEIQHDWGTVVWAFLACGVTVLGWYTNRRELRINGYVMIAATVLRTFALNLDHSSSLRVPTVSLVALILYASVYLMRREEVESLDRAGRSAVGAAASLIVFALLGAEVQGRLLTVAWGLQGAALLAGGFIVRDKLYRISGLLLFLLCIGKLFFFDLSELDTLSRIFSFIVLGLLLLAASWVYTRYRDQLRKLL